MIRCRGIFLFTVQQEIKRLKCFILSGHLIIRVSIMMFFANPELAAQVIEMQRQQLIALGLIQAPIYIDDLTGGGGDGGGIVPDPVP